MIRILLVDILIVGLWSLLTCILCKKVDIKHFDERRKRYQPQKWENDGRWYKNTLKINKWKDLIPQYISKGGFSKENFGKSNLDAKYIDRFILETCRAEWVHSLFPLVAVVIIWVSGPVMGVILSLIILTLSMMLVAIQRYNRFRLQKIRKKILK